MFPSIGGASRTAVRTVPVCSVTSVDPNSEARCCGCSPMRTLALSWLEFAAGRAPKKVQLYRSVRLGVNRRRRAARIRLSQTTFSGDRSQQDCGRGRAKGRQARLRVGECLISNESTCMECKGDSHGCPQVPWLTRLLPLRARGASARSTSLRTTATMDTLGCVQRPSGARRKWPRASCSGSRIGLACTPRSGVRCALRTYGVRLGEHQLHLWRNALEFKPSTGTYRPP